MAITDYKAALKQLGKGELAGLYLLAGDRHDQLDNLLAAIEKEAFADGGDPGLNRELLRFPEGNRGDIGAKQAEVMQAAIAAAETMPFLASRRLIIVRDFSMPTVDSDCAKLIEALLGTDLSTATVVLTSAKVDKRSKLAKRLVEQAVTVELATSEREVAVEIERRARELGVEIDPRAVQMLKARYGTDMDGICMELDKLVNYIGNDDKIGPDDVEALVFGETANWWFRLTGALADRDPDSAFNAVRHLLEESSPALPPSVLVPTLAKQLWRLLAVRSADRSLRSPKAIADATGYNQYYIKNTLLPAALKFTGEKQMKDMLDELSALDVKLKTGALQPRAQLEKAILRLCGTGGPTRVRA